MARPLSLAPAALLGVLFLAVASSPLGAEGSPEPRWSLVGEAGPALELTANPTPGGGLSSPRLLFLGARSSLDLSAERGVFLLRAGLQALAPASSPSGTLGATALSLELEEFELAWLPAPGLALRAGKLRRSLGLGEAYSPADPFALAPGSAGYWALEGDFSGNSSLSALALLSLDRAALASRLPKAEDLDGGLVLRGLAGPLDAGLGAYLRGGVEARLLGEARVSLLGFLAGLEGGYALPLGAGKAAGALRASLGRGFDLGPLSAELDLAWRHAWPGRSPDEIAQLALAAATAAAAHSAPPYAPFAPYLGSDYGELSLSLETEAGSSLSAGLVLPRDLEGLNWEAGLEIWQGELRLSLGASGLLGADASEFRSLALATGQPALDLRAELDLSL